MDDRVYRALGLMSGTSLDGVDVAIIETDGVDIKRFRDSAFMRFSDYEKEQLQSAVQDALEWGFDGEQSLPKSFADAEEVIHQAHFRALRLVQEEYAHHGGRLRTYPALSVIGLHGQTVLHKAPSEDTLGRTLQLGDGERFARESRTDVVYDFRSADVAAGGQGAPLAPIYHEALVRYSKLEGRIAVLNIGGVSNVTAIEDGKIAWATDCAEILSAEDVGWDGDMLEAQAFAYLAVRTLKGIPISFPETTGAPRPMTGGRIAYPSSSLGSRGGE